MTAPRTTRGSSCCGGRRLPQHPEQHLKHSGLISCPKRYVLALHIAGEAAVGQQEYDADSGEHDHNDKQPGAAERTRRLKKTRICDTRQKFMNFVTSSMAVSTASPVLLARDESKATRCSCRLVAKAPPLQLSPASPHMGEVAPGCAVCPRLAVLKRVLFCGRARFRLCRKISYFNKDINMR